MIIENTLFPPQLPQMLDDGVITESELSENGMIDIIAVKYENAAVGDYFRCFFNNVDIGSFLVADPLTDFPHIFYKSASELSDGTYPVYFNSTDVALNTSYSEVVFAVLNRGGVGELLPPPVFSDAVDDMLSYEQVANQHGTNILIPSYSDNAVGDEIFASFYVKNLAGIVVPGSEFSFKHVLEETELLGGFQSIIPEQYILLVTQGVAFLSYNVHPVSGSPDRYSSTASVKLFSDDLGSKKNLGGASGYFTPDNSVIQECYVEFLAAKDNSPLPDSLIELSISGENYFHSNGEKYLTVRSDADGRAIAHLSGVDSNMNVITGNILGSNITSSIGFSVNRGNVFSTPWLTVTPSLSTIEMYPLSLHMRGPASKFNIFAGTGTVIVVDDVEMQELRNVYLSESEVFDFYVKSVDGGSCQLKVTDQESIHVFCEIIF